VSILVPSHGSEAALGIAGASGAAAAGPSHDQAGSQSKKVAAAGVCQTNGVPERAAALAALACSRKSACRPTVPPRTDGLPIVTRPGADSWSSAASGRTALVPSMLNFTVT
jgi:hypothetical protein